MKARGSRAEVMHGKAKRTSGGLMKKDLKYNKRRKIVSKRASARAKKDNRLVKAGYKTKKGVFSLNKKRRSKRRSRRQIQLGGGESDEDTLKILKDNEDMVKRLISVIKKRLSKIIQNTPGVVWKTKNLKKFKDDYMYDKLKMYYDRRATELVIMKKDTRISKRDKFARQNLVDLLMSKLKELFPDRFSPE